MSSTFQRIRGGRSSLVVVAAAALGCAGTPLGADWNDLSPAARDRRAVDTLSDLFARRLDGAGATVSDREVLLADLEGISYEREGGTSHLRWRDVDAVEQDDHPDLPSRAVDLRLYLREGSWSEQGVKDVVEPALVGTGLFRRYIVLRMRPRGSRARLLTALEHLRGRAAEELAARAPRTTPAAVDSAVVAPVATSAPSPGTPPAEATDAPDRLDDTEATLRRLKAWRDEGLITEEEYQAKRKALLEGL